MTQPVLIGQFLDGAQFRDAIHIAICPVTATENLRPGQDIGFITELDTNLVMALPRPRHHGTSRRVNVDETLSGRVAIGIVDPFLPRPAKKGDVFYMWLYPNTITSLRHDWTHPAFAATDSRESQKQESMRWLERLGDRVGFSAEELIQAGKDWLASQGRDYFSSYLVGDYRMDGEQTPPEFWTHFEILTGITVPDEHKGDSFFRCSC